MKTWNCKFSSPLRCKSSISQDCFSQGPGSHPFEKWKWKLLSHVWLFATPWTIYSPWNSPGQNTGVGSLSLLQGIFPTQGSNPGLLHCRQILYQLNHKGSPLNGYRVSGLVQGLHRLSWCGVYHKHSSGLSNMGSNDPECSLSGHPGGSGWYSSVMWFPQPL